MIPSNTFFGTSSWTFEGWKGDVYQKEYSSKQRFTQTSLEEYAAHPLFQIVGIDSFHYAPPTVKKLTEYAAQVPDTFQWVSKVWEHLTLYTFPTHKRYGKRAGCINPDFLDADIFLEKVLEPYSQADVLTKTGPFVFQFSPFDPRILEPSRFLSLLDSFLTKLPKDFRYAVEIRNAQLLCTDYFSALNSAQVTHCFNHWTNMPPLIDQMKIAALCGGLEADFFLTRALSPLGMSHAESQKIFSPYNEIKQPQTQLRQDILRLIKRAIERNNDAYIIIGNRLEGCAPQTIREILDLFEKA